MTDEGLRVDKVSLAEQLHSGGGSAFARYKNKAAGNISLQTLLFYEFFNLALANLGGALGYLTRKWCSKFLFKIMGGGLIIGRGLVIRHPKNISIGNNVAVDDNVFIDASGSGEKGVQLDDGVIISRNCVVQAKTGHVVLGKRVDVGCNTVFSSVAGITIGASTIIAGNCYIGGGRYYHGRLDQPIMDQGGYSKGPVIVGEMSWIGAGAVILDGVKIGRGVIIGAGSVVTRDVADFTVVAGVPAKVLQIREERR